MTASRYQRGSAGAGAAAPPAGRSVRSGTSSSTAASLSTRLSMRGASEEVVEVAFGPHPAAEAQDVRRQALGIELHEVPPALPDVARVGEEIVHLERARVLEAERGRV